MSEATLPQVLKSDPAASATPMVFLLSEDGRIRFASGAARTFWQAHTSEVEGEHFVSLFDFEVVSSDADWVESQWEVLIAAGQSETLDLQARSRDGVSKPVRVRLEKLSGSERGFVGLVELPISAAPAPAVPETADAGLALLVEKGLAGYFDLNFRENRIQYSPAWKRIFGYVDSELPNTYDTWLKLIHPDDSAAAPDKLARKRPPGPAPFVVEFRMRHRRGHDVWVQCLGVQQVGDEGHLERVVGLTLDISERKEIEETTLANDDRLQTLAASGAPLAAFEFDFAETRFWYSDACRKLLGLDDSAESPELLQPVLPADVAAGGVAAYFLGLAPGQTFFTEVVQVTAVGGTPQPILLGVYRKLSRKHELARVLGFFCMLPEGAVTAAVPGALPPALVTQSLAVLSEGLIATDDRGRILAVNPTASRLLQLPAEKALGLPVSQIFRLVNRQTGRPSDDVLDRVLAAEGTLPLIDADALLSAAGQEAGGEESTSIPIVWTARLAADSSGRPQGVTIAFRNPDEMELTPLELIQSNRFESLAIRAGGIAHDFNNILTTVLGGISMAKDSRDYTMLADAEKACMTAKGLSRQLLSLTKGAPSAAVVLGAREILESAVKIAAAGSSTEVTVETASDVDPVLVDRGQVLQVFQNLVINSLQAMPPPPHRPRVQLSATNITLDDGQFPPLPAGNFVQFVVRDNGNGIKPENLQRIWDPFFTTKRHGTGLGLATVLSIIRQHGGIVGVESTPGVGTAFTLYLPATERTNELQARPAATLRFGTGRILLMDDDAAIQNLTMNMLQSLDYKVDTARNGEEALKLYKRYLNIGRPYDAVILDLTVIGGMGGEECFRHLKGLDPDVRAVVSSGYDSDELSAQFLELGFCGFLTKPYRVTDLGKLLKSILG